MLKVHNVPESIRMDGLQVFRLGYLSGRNTLINTTGLAASGFHCCCYPAGHTHISMSSGRLENANAPIVSKATFSDMELK